MVPISEREKADENPGPEAAGNVRGAQVDEADDDSARKGRADGVFVHSQNVKAASGSGGEPDHRGEAQQRFCGQKQKEAALHVGGGLEEGRVDQRRAKGELDIARQRHNGVLAAPVADAGEDRKTHKEQNRQRQHPQRWPETAGGDINRQHEDHQRGHGVGKGDKDGGTVSQ